jgi:hypothetical protein
MMLARTVMVEDVADGDVIALRESNSGVSEQSVVDNIVGSRWHDKIKIACQRCTRVIKVDDKVDNGMTSSR